MKKYICYETDFNFIKTESELIELYDEIIDKSEYQTYDIWFMDMIRSGLLTEVK